MKKQILLAASVLASTLLFAQEKPTVGIRAGASSATLRGDAVQNLGSVLDFTGGAVTTSSRNGIFAGGYVNIPLSKEISIEPGVFYAQKGYQLNGALNVKGAEFLGANARAQLTSHYVDLPVVVKANFNGFQVFAGPQVSYLAKADLHTRAGVLGFNVVNNRSDVSSEFNRWDAGLTGGVGYQFSNGLTITAAYDHGLSRINSGRNVEAYNRAVKVGLGFRF
jgi:hypothetical protein